MYNCATITTTFEGYQHTVWKVMNAANNTRKRRKLKKSVKRWFTGILIFLASLFIFLIWEKPAGSAKNLKAGSVKVDRYRDLNPAHLKHAKAFGIDPIERDSEVENKTDKLVRIRNSRYYIVEKLTHSHPYLTPETAELLTIIGKRFHANLKEKGMNTYQFRVTSVLRTRESQKRLTRSNINAAGESSHLYGTTFDISWKSLVKKNFWGTQKNISNPGAVKILSETIGELRKEGILVVVTEYKEACFHITLSKKK